MRKLLVAALLVLAACGDSEPRALRVTITYKEGAKIGTQAMVAPMYEAADEFRKRADLVNKETARITPAQKRAFLKGTREQAEFVSITVDCVTKEEAAGGPTFNPFGAG